MPPWSWQLRNLVLGRISQLSAVIFEQCNITYFIPSCITRFDAAQDLRSRV